MNQVSSLAGTTLPTLCLMVVSTPCLVLVLSLCPVLTSPCPTPTSPCPTPTSPPWFAKKQSYDLIAYVRFTNPNPLPIGVYAYVSDSNSIEELWIWIAFYRVQNVSLVILYVTVPMPELEIKFKDIIETGYLRLMDFTWSRKSVFNHIQRSNQQAQNQFLFLSLQVWSEVVDSLRCGWI